MTSLSTIVIGSALLTIKSVHDNVSGACVANIKAVECVGVLAFDPCFIIRHACCPP